MPKRKSADSPRTLRQYDDLEILDYIDRHKKQVGRSPSERQIATALQLSGKSVAHRIVRRLVDRTLLTSSVPSPGWPADLALTQAGRYALIPWRAQREKLATTEQQAPLATSHVASGAKLNLVRGAA